MRARPYLYPAFLGALVSVQAFTFTNSVPTECGNFQVSWTGGRPPFVLEIVPIAGAQKVFNIPDSAFSNGAGSFSTQLQFAKEQQFFVTMSDATGVATGGISPVLTVEAAVGSATCNMANLRPDFFFSLDDALQQCRPYRFTAFSGAIQPVTIYAMVPGGTATVLNPPNQSTEFAWSPASVSAGTGIVFVMSDSAGRTGGASGIKVSGSTSDTSCLNSNSPALTLQGTSSTTSISATPTATQTSPASSSPATSKSTSTALVAAIVGVVVGLGALLAFGIFILRRYRRNQPDRQKRHFELDESYRDEPSTVPYMVNPFPPPNRPSTVTPYEMSTMATSTAGFAPPPTAEETAPLTSSLPPSPPVPPPRARKANLAASTTRYEPARLVVHRDLEEVAPEDNVIELPPQYSENRQPLAFSETASHATSPSQSSYRP
ncbi:hypothetical protein BJV78DRAFT_1278000 [Lactifluus subvellereus]|nr:hypothetical protein BJV78DRAFT_1278000 [Lactifluus subvellereus]